MSIILGWNYSRVQIFPPSRLPTTIDLPLTNEGGMIERPDFTMLSAEVMDLDFDNYNSELLQDTKGYRINFEYHFEDFIDGETLMLWNQIIVASKAGYELRLYPRVDQLSRVYTVKLTNSNLLLGIRKGGQNAQWHRLPIFTFATTNLQADLGWFIAQPAPEYAFIMEEAASY